MAERSPERRTELIALGAALVTVVVWASAFVGIRSAGHWFAPGSLSFGRMVVSAAALGIVFVVRGEALPTRAQLRATWLPLLVTGVLWFGVYHLFLNSGERRVDAGTASML